MSNPMQVELLGAWSGLDKNLDIAIAKSARISFLNDDKIRTMAQDTKLIQYLWDHQHGTPFEQVQYQFKITAPVVVWWHLVN